MNIDIVLIALGVLVIGGAVMVLVVQDIVGAIVASGLISLIASIVFLILGAPDVAMTEAAIGSGLTTVVFLYSWSRIRHQSEGAHTQRDADTAGGVIPDPAHGTQELHDA
jgi:uncharacterized MnhB-related membrane protein